MDHVLKIDRKEYFRLSKGIKTFLIYDSDEEFQMGDILVLKEWDDEPQNSTTKSPKGFTGSQDLKYQCGFIHNMGLKSVISLLAVKSKKS